MRKIRIFAFVPLFIGAVIISAAFINPKKPVRNTTKFDGKGFAVVELFTSEGCSSCPPADDLVAKVQKEITDKPVYILAYHVDYWNRLGWKDVFSSADYSKRQNEYAQWLNLSSVYTPQIVVNGKTEFVGSQEGSLRNAIKAGLQKNAAVQLALNTSKTGHNATVQYKVDGGADAGNVLSLALVQKQAVIKVERGENGGRTLAHAQIVRNIQTIALNKNSGSATIALPAGFEAQGWEVIGFIQNPINGAILGASKTGFALTAGVDSPNDAKNIK